MQRRAADHAAGVGGGGHRHGGDQQEEGGAEEEAEQQAEAAHELGEARHEAPEDGQKVEADVLRVLAELHPAVRVEVGGVTRHLRLFEVAPGVRIAILNILGDTEFVAAASKELIKRFDSLNYQAFITAAAKSIPLVHQLSMDTQRPYVVLRKSYKSYMGEAISAETESITTGAKQTLYLDEKDRSLIENRSVIIVDDVVSTGSTLSGMREVVARANGTVAAEAAIFTEGDADKWQHIVALGNLPVWLDE